MSSKKTRREVLTGGLRLAGGLALGSWMLKNGASAAQPARRWNMVYVLIDDLGWADPGCYGNTFHETPNIDRLTAEGMRFTDAYAACHICSPTRSSILTGKYPARMDTTHTMHAQLPQTGPDRMTTPRHRMSLPHAELTLAEALKPAGYATAQVGKWHLGKGEENEPLKHGFDTQVRLAGPAVASYYPPYTDWRYWNKLRPRNDFQPSRIEDGEYLTDRLTDEALEFIDANTARPFFLYLPYHAVHQASVAKPDLLEHYRRKGPDRREPELVYAAHVHAVDQNLGRILDHLAASGQADRTVLMFMSDNGSRFSNRPLRSGKGQPYEGGIRVPFIVRWPRVVEPGTTCSVPVSSVDHYPTILNIVGVKGNPTHSRNVDGVSLVPLLRQTGDLQRYAIFWHYPHYRHTKPYGAVRAGEWKLIEWYEDMRVELYNLAEDIGESSDLADARPEKAAELRQMLRDWRRSVGARMPHWPSDARND